MPTIRRYRPEDADGLAALFFRAVHDGAADSYGPAQRAAWAPVPPSGPDWTLRLGGGVTFVAETAEGIAGFMTLSYQGYLDLAFVLPEARGRGVADGLYTRLEREARSMGLSRLWSDASYPARQFLLKRGWTVLAEQHVERAGVTLTNFRMEKHLARA